mgnify:CR=1 FL=1
MCKKLGLVTTKWEQFSKTSLQGVDDVNSDSSYRLAEDIDGTLQRFEFDKNHDDKPDGYIGVSGGTKTLEVNYRDLDTALDSLKKYNLLSTEDENLLQTKYKNYDTKCKLKNQKKR